MTKTPSPSPTEIKAARLRAGLTQKQAAALVHLSAQQRWDEYEHAKKHMRPATWELFLLKTGV